MKPENWKRLLVPALAFTLACLAGIAGFARLGTGQKAPLIFSSAAAAETEPEPVSSRATERSVKKVSETRPDSPERDFPVYITGAVMNPGVYRVSRGSYLFELVEMAGGFTDNAAAEGINLAGRLEPEAHIIIPDVFSEPEAPRVRSGAAAGPVSGSVKPLLDINTASAAELEALPGIGAKTAGDIIAFRERNGKFSAIEGLMEVPGIKEGKYSKFKDLIRAG